MNPLCFLIIVALGAVILTGSRRSALVALFAGALYIPQYQAINIGLNLFPTRLLEIALLIRLLSRRELSAARLNTIDRGVLWLYAYVTLVYLVRAHEGQAFQIGVMVDSYLAYFGCRALIDSPETFRWVLRKFVILLAPFALLVVIERLTGRSPLAFMYWGGLGGVWVREGGVRCFGPFRHPSLLGTIGVGFIPIYIGMLFSSEERKWGIWGIVLCGIVVWTTNSGGPVSGVAFGCIGWVCWIFRKKMRTIRWAIVGFILLAGAMMKAPVWYLVERVSQFTGGDGWHRSYLMDVSFQHFSNWWLCGMPIADTSDWFPYTLDSTGGADLTNQFLSFGITAGVGAMALFILVLKRAYSVLGNALWAVRAASLRSIEGEFFLWGFGAMLAAHIVNWLGINYFDQTYLFWWAQLAAVSSLSEWYLNQAPQTEGEAATERTGSELEEVIPVTAQ